MSTTLEYILNIKGNIDKKLKSIGIANDQQLEKWAHVQKMVASAENTMNSMGRSIGSINQRIAALRSQKEWIPSSNRAAIAATNKEINELENELRELENTSGSVNPLSKWFGELKSHIPLLGLVTNPLVLLGGAVYKASSFVRAGTEAYKEESVTMTKLAQIMGNTMGARKAEVESVQDLVAMQERLGVVSGGVQLAGSQELATYLTKSSTLKKLIPTMNDMLVQQYGLNASQEQAVGLGSMLGKVMNGQVGALSRYGYSFDAAQEKILKFGTEEERAAVLADVVASAVGGMNEAMASTPEGKLVQNANELDAIQTRAGRLWSVISQSFVPLHSKIQGMIADIVSFFEANEHGIRDIVRTIASGLGSALSFIGKVLGTIIKGFGWFIKQFKEGNPLIQAFAGFVAIAAAGILAYNAYTTIAANITSLWAKRTLILNAVMYANPIGLIVAGVAALVAYVTIAIRKYEEFGAAMLMLLGPIGMIVNSVMTFKRYWDSIVEAFSSDGILAGLKRIGIALLDTMLYPVQQLLEMLSKIPGLGKLAAKGAGSLAEMRARMNMIDPAKSKKKYSQSEAEDDAAYYLGGGMGGGGGVTDASGVTDGNKDIVTGGKKNVTVNINIAQMLQNMKIDVMQMQEGIDALEERIVEAVTRAVAIGSSLGV